MDIVRRYELQAVAGAVIQQHPIDFVQAGNVMVLQLDEETLAAEHLQIEIHELLCELSIPG